MLFARCPEDSYGMDAVGIVPPDRTTPWDSSEQFDRRVESLRL